MNFRLVFKLTGKTLLVEAGALLLPLLVCLFYRENPLPFLLSIAMTGAVGLALSLIPSNDHFFPREGFFAVALIWLLMSAFGALPFFFSGFFPSYVDCFFESVSGFTTTGASILTAVEPLPRGILFWRSFMHWMGGMGVLILTIALLPSLGGRTLHVMRAESPGPIVSKLVPKTSQSSKILYGIYCALTLLEVFCLRIAGMPWYDSLVHSFATAGTGGFSTRNLSIAAYESPAIEVIITLFMLIFSINFALYFLLLCGKVHQALRSDELRFFLAVVGFFAARVLLELMSCPEDVIGLSTLYLKIYFIGMPMTMLYNFSSALLRAVGDTRRPLFCLAVAGAINVVLNLVFVILFSMSVAGVALATIISQTVSACMVTALLVKEKGPLHLDLGHLGFHAGALGQILRIGLPAGLQSTVFSLSNVVIQSAVNSFGSIVVAGNSAASNLEGFVYTAMNAFAQAAVTFTSQNMGARRYDNLDRVMRNCLLCAAVTGLVLGGGASLLGEPLLHFYSSDEVVVTAGLARMHIICTTYLLCGCMDVLASCLRGRGYSVLPMVVSLVGSCLLRLVWIATIFRLFHTTTMLYLSYPVSWILTALVHLACLLVVRHKMNENLKATAQR